MTPECQSTISDLELLGYRRFGPATRDGFVSVPDTARVAVLVVDCAAGEKQLMVKSGDPVADPDPSLDTRKPEPAAL